MRFDRRSRTLMLCALAAVGVCLARTASADPVIVVSGSVYYSWGDPAFFSSLAGAGFSADGSFGDERYYPAYALGTVCPGCPIDPSVTESVTQPSISFEVDGRRYLASAMVFAIGAGMLTVPDDISGDSTRLSYTAWTPFHFSGWIEGTPYGQEEGGPLRHVDLTGTGNVRLGFGENHWWVSVLPVRHVAVTRSGSGTRDTAARCGRCARFRPEDLDEARDLTARLSPRISARTVAGMRAITNNGIAGPCCLSMARSRSGAAIDSS